MLELGFTKYEGLGNDFVVVTRPRGAGENLGEFDPSLAAKICSRNFGVGADGVLLASIGTDGRYGMRVFNADGSTPEMCGNGLRCVALHAALTTGSFGEITVDTDAGEKRCIVERTGENTGLVEVDMGTVKHVGDTSLEVGGHTFDLALADAGNPHAIYTGVWTRELVDACGLALATHPFFARGTNVEFVRVLSRTHAEVLVWERGVGITLACGTGACATAMTLVRSGQLDANAPTTITLPGGDLTLTVRTPAGGSPTTLTSAEVTMRGPARRVFEGHIRL